MNEGLALPRRGRGRPPKPTGEYSRGYGYVKRYRERHKSQVHVLKERLEEKLAELQLLEAENQVLQVREKVLHLAFKEPGAALPGLASSTPAFGGGQGQALQHQGKQPTQRPAQQQMQQRPPQQAARQQELMHVKEAWRWQVRHSVQRLLQQTPPLPPECHDPRHTPVVREFVTIYREHFRHLVGRMGPGGRVRPLMAGEARYPPNREMAHLYMQMSPSEQDQVLMTNMETGHIVSSLPAGHWDKVAIAFNPGPKSLFLASVMGTYFKAFERIMEQRRELQARLAAALLHVEAPGGFTATTMEAEQGADDAEEAMAALSANLLREHRVRNVTGGMINMALAEEQAGHGAVVSWPFICRWCQVCSLLYGPGGAYSPQVPR